MLRVTHRELRCYGERLDPRPVLPYRRFDCCLIERVFLHAGWIMSAAHAYDDASQVPLDARLCGHAVIEAHEHRADRTEAVLHDRVGRERRRNGNERDVLPRAFGQRCQNGAQRRCQSHRKVPVRGERLGAGDHPAAAFQCDRVRIRAARVEPDPDLAAHPRLDSALRDAASAAFDSNIAIVIGPRPPGTGVIQPARSTARSYPTSPTILPAASRLMPTSKTAAPGLIQSPGM